MSSSVKARPYDSPRRREQAAATRQRILEAGERLFIAQGFAATSVPQIAREAGVALKTVYVAFDTKAGLLQALWETRLSPGEEEVPVLERDWYQALRAEQGAQRRLELLAAQSRAVKSRSGDLMEVIRNAAAADGEIETLWRQIQHNLLIVQRAVVKLLAESNSLSDHLDQTTAADIRWTLNHPSVWHLLVRGRGWSAEQYEQWLARAFCSQVLESS